MKKTYIYPEILAVELRTKHMMAQSLSISMEDVIDDENDILVKDYGKNNTSIWDEEW